MSNTGMTDILDNVKDYYGKQVQTTADLKTQACVSFGNPLSRDIKAALAEVHEEVCNNDQKVLDSVKHYYGKELTCSADLKTPECISSGDDMTKAMKVALSEIHDEVTNRYYGCGLVIPEVLEGMNVLDLGSGSGRDCFAISKLVGQNGHVTGVDMTDEQLEVANRYIQYHTDKFGYSKPNVKYVKGYIEKLTEAGIQEDSIDIIVSNCVVNLSPDKRAVLSEAYRALKVGGELYFSDIYSDRILSDEIRKHEVLWGECISGALWWEELYTLAKEIGFSAPRLVTASPVNVDREDFKKVLGDAKFVSATYRLFKLPKERASPKQVIYSGTISGFESKLDFDHQTKFMAGDVKGLDSEMVTILQCSRFKDEFEFQPTKLSENTESTCCPEINSKVDPFAYMKSREKAGEKIEAACSGPKCC